MGENIKMEHLIVIFAINGEHLTLECDEIRKGKEELWLYKGHKDVNGDDERDLIAAFQLKNIIGWEQIR